MLEALINFKLSMIHKKSKKEVTDKFKEYESKYQNMSVEASVIDKSEYRDLKHDFIRYISSSKEDGGTNGII